MTACLLDQDRLSRELKDRKTENDNYAIKIYEKYLASVGSPTSLYFASRLALLESRMATIFDNNANPDDSATTQVDQIKKNMDESTKIYTEMAQYYHSDDPNYWSVLIEPDTAEHLRLLRLYGFTHSGDGEPAQSMIQLATIKLAESQNTTAKLE